jgi:hypothetical protein
MMQNKTAKEKVVMTAMTCFPTRKIGRVEGQGSTMRYWNRMNATYSDMGAMKNKNDTRTNIPRPNKIPNIMHSI